MCLWVVQSRPPQRQRSDPNDWPEHGLQLRPHSQNRCRQVQKYERLHYPNPLHQLAILWRQSGQTWREKGLQSQKVRRSGKNHVWPLSVQRKPGLVAVTGHYKRVDKAGFDSRESCPGDALGLDHRQSEADVLHHGYEVCVLAALA